MTAQPRERAVPCQLCWPRTRRTTWNTSAVCDDCTPEPPDEDDE